MPLYNYTCTACEKKALKRHRKDLIVLDDGTKKLPDELFEEHVLFETSHGINPTPAELKEATTCPRCGGTDCQRSYYGYNPHGYIKGYGWLDRAGIKRDMNIHKLTTEDPYAQYRVDGEVEDIKTKLQRAGKRDPKTDYFDVGQKSMEKAVEKATKESPK